MKGFLAPLIVGLSLQTSLSGKWVVEPRAPQCLGGAGASGQGGGCSDGGGAKVLCGDALSIDIRGTSITIERIANGEKLTMMFPLDGAAVQHVMPVCRELRQDEAAKAERDVLMQRLSERGFDRMTTRATRDGTLIVLRSTFGTETSTLERTQVLSLTTLGHLLVETTSALNGLKGPPQRMVYSRMKPRR
jgi:hypothetical protein